MGKNFDDVLAPEVGSPYLSVVPDRSPRRKAHPTLGQAKNALQYRRSYYHDGYSVDIAIYEYRDNAWHLLYEVAKGEKVAPWERT